MMGLDHYRVQEQEEHEEKARADCERSLKAHVIELTWTCEKPTESGWYWMRGDWSGNKPHIVWVEVYHSTIDVSCDGGLFVVRDHWEFAGPIPEPMGAKS